MGNTFKPLTESQPLSYATNRAAYYRNAAREKKWGSPVYFVPANNGYDVTGQAGPGYKYGYSYNVNNGMYGNCTWWVMGRCHEANGIILNECIGDASGFYSKYRGSKDGGSYSNGKYFGDTIRPGDILVWADSNTKLGVGHVTFVENVIDNTLIISESGYSKNTSYKGMACVVYTLDKTKFKCGAAIKLRPQSPYTEYAYGVIHTGADSHPWVAPRAVEKDTSKDQLYIGNVSLNIRDEASTASCAMGSYNKPNSYFDVKDVAVKSDFTWYHLGDDAWVAGCDKEVVYYPKKENKQIENPEPISEPVIDTDEICKLNNKINELSCKIDSLNKEVSDLNNDIICKSNEITELKDIICKINKLTNI